MGFGGLSFGLREEGARPRIGREGREERGLSSSFLPSRKKNGSLRAPAPELRCLASQARRFRQKVDGIARAHAGGGGAHVPKGRSELRWEGTEKGK